MDGSAVQWPTCVKINLSMYLLLNIGINGVSQTIFIWNVRTMIQLSEEYQYYQFNSVPIL